MGSEDRWLPGAGLGLSLVVRALLIAGLAFSSVAVFITTRHGAVALVLAICAALLLADLIRFASAADSALARSLDCIVSGETSRSIAALQPRLANSVDKALAELKAERAHARAIADHLRALCDNSSAALFTIDEGGGWHIVNRAAWSLVGNDGARALDSRLGRESVQVLQELMAGRQAIIRVPDGVRVLADVTQFASGGKTQRLISLLPVDQMLDRVETQAWRELVRMLAHEMMNSLTPITSLAGSMSMMMRDLKVEPESEQALGEVAAALEMIQRRSAGIFRFVEECRNVGTIPVIAPESFRVRDLVDGVATLMLEGQSRPTALIACDVDPPDVEVFADRVLVEQALINVVRNAQDATAGKDDARITMVGRNSGQFATIAVSDNGSGISSEVASKVFVPFFSTKAGGTGIGLTLVRQIVLAHGGKVELNIGAPEGTTVVLHLPRGRS